MFAHSENSALHLLYTIARFYRDTGLIMYLCCILHFADSASSPFLFQSIYGIFKSHFTADGCGSSSVPGYDNRAAPNTLGAQRMPIGACRLLHTMFTRYVRRSFSSILHECMQSCVQTSWWCCTNTNKKICWLHVIFNKCLIIACNNTSGMMQFSSQSISIAFTHYRHELKVSQALRK